MIAHTPWAIFFYSLKIYFSLASQVMTQGKKLLIVDDDESIIEVLEDLFIHEGFEVKVASNGAMALTQLNEFMPDLLLLDYNMPEMNGWK